MNITTLSESCIKFTRGGILTNLYIQYTLNYCKASELQSEYHQLEYEPLCKPVHEMVQSSMHIHLIVCMYRSAYVS